MPQNSFEASTAQYFKPGTDDFYRQVGRVQGQQAAQARLREQYKEYVNAGLKMMESDDPDTMQRGLAIVNQIAKQTGMPIQFPDSLPNSQAYTDFSRRLQTILNGPKLSGPQKLQLLTEASLRARGARQTEAARNPVTGVNVEEIDPGKGAYPLAQRGGAGTTRGASGGWQANQPPLGYKDSGKTSGGKKVWLSPDGKKAWIEE